MTTVSGPLVNVTTSASSVRDVQVHTKKVRAWGDGLMTPDPSPATLSNGVVEFEAAPGPVVMVLFMAEAGAETVSLVVGEGATQSLADAYRDGQMASDRDASELAGILEQIRESVGGAAEARAGAEAAAADAAGSAESAGRDADRAESAAGEAATEAAGLAADAVRLEVKEDADRSAAGATTATEKAAEAAGSATRAEEAETGAVEAEEGAEAGQELSEDAAAVAVAAAVGAAEASSNKADTTYVDAQDTALGKRITDEKWWRGTLGSGDSLDGLRGTSAMGLYRVSPAVAGGPGLGGWVEVTYDSNSTRTRQVFTASSPSDSVSLERKYSGGSWREWSPVTWHGVSISSGSADDLRTPHVYAVHVTGLSGLPVPLLGSLEVLPAGADTSTLTQIFTSSESTPRTWKRARRAGQWGEWVQLTTMQDVNAAVDEALSDFEVPDLSPQSMVLDATETPISSGAQIVASMTEDGRVGYNNLAPQLNQSFDNGVTWERVRTFGGQYVEWCEPLPTGELMVCTNGTVGGKSGRHIWVSAGYDRDNPTAATWEITKQNPFPEVKYANWSFYAHENRVLLADYGPKSGMSWGSLNPVPEGENARYVYQSLDGGYTWETIFDLNDFLLSNGRTTADRQHLHGVAWDKWWNRIWVTFGDAAGDGTNGVVYSDDEGATWQAAYWTHTHVSQGWQVVGIQPMQDVVLFAGDMTPSGLIALDRSEGRDAFNFYTAWDFSETEKHLCHVIRYSSGPLGEIAMFAFAREGSASPSFIVGTRDGREFVVLWQESGTSLPGIKTLAGPSADGTVIASNSTSAGWVEVSGRLHVTGSPWVPDGVPAVQKQVDGLVDALEAKADTTYVDAQDTALGSRIDAEKWYRPMLRSGDTLDDKRGTRAVGVYPVTAAVAGAPRNTAGWVEVFYNADTSSTTQRFFAASWAVSGEWEREHWAGSWREWRDTSMQTAIAGKADTVHEHTASQITDLHHYSGTGFPEGKVTAPVGATYTDTAATNGAVRWIKTSGTGATGWQVEYGDTGWRNISAATTSTNQQGSLRRVGNMVYLTFLGAKFDTTTGATIYSLPAPFRPGRDTYFESVPYWSADTRRAGRARFGGEMEIRSLTSEDTITFNISWPTDNPWPTSLPGTPA